MAVEGKNVFQWSDEMTLSLINTKISVNNVRAGQNIWREVATKFKEDSGVTMSPKQCKKKWENLLRKYKELKKPPGTSTWQFYDILDEFLSSTTTPPVVTETGSPPVMFDSSQPDSPSGSPYPKIIPKLAPSSMPDSNHSLPLTTYLYLPNPPQAKKRKVMVTEEEYRSQFLEFLKNEDRRRERQEEREEETIGLLKEIVDHLKNK